MRLSRSGARRYTAAVKATTAVVTDQARVDAIADEIREVGAFVFDLEFASDGRFIPELALIQLGWGDRESPEIALLDTLAVDPGPIFELIESEHIETVAHAATQDLSLLATRAGVKAHAFWDTQIAAAFTGIGEQIGYGKLVAHLTGVSLDKGAQFTKWLRRPLTDRQLVYAANDVLYLPRIWAELRERLEDSGRLEWVRAESAALADKHNGLPAEDQAYKTVKAWQNLRPQALGALRELAAWRLRTAVRQNKPLPWLLQDRAMVELCRSPPGGARELARVRGIGDGTVRRYGDDIIDALTRGAKKPVELEASARPALLSPAGQVWVQLLSNLIQARCAEAGIAPRFVGTRADVEALVGWFEAGQPADAEPALLSTWRRDIAGDAVISWLRGEATIAVGTDGGSPLRLVPKP